MTKTSENKIKEIITLYAKGLSSIEIGRLVGVGKTTVRRMLKENHIYIRNSKEASKNGIEHQRWKTGKFIRRNQIYILINGKRVKESHYNWCCFNNIGQIPKNMIIHHKDCNFKNNNPENLILLDKITHMKLHQRINEEKFSGIMI